MTLKLKLRWIALLFLLAALAVAFLLPVLRRRPVESRQSMLPVASDESAQMEQMASANRTRPSSPGFELDSSNAKRMIGRNDPKNERWADIAGNFYSAEFIRGFSYETTNDGSSCVWIQIKPAGKTLSGRLEAHGLKPNFAYQLKLMGDFNDRTAFERIGYRGRWRLPGQPTNYTDWDYQACPEKQNVESYILFDFFVTDVRGDAVLDFALAQSLHVLWNASRQNVLISVPNVRRREIGADSPAIYARPKQDVTTEYVYGEPEMSRYAGDGSTRLPEGRYSASLVLTEESFHGYGRDNGYWATPLRLPMEFYIVGDENAGRRRQRLP